MKNIFKTYLLSGSLVAVGIFGCNNTKGDKIGETRNLESPSYAGTYEFGVDIEKGPVGTVKIYPLQGDSAIFHIDVNRGAPSYNMGQVSGHILIKDGLAEYKIADCQLKFSFKGKGLEISQDGSGDCGFGHAVSASATYKLTDSTVPEYYIKSDGDTVRFQP